MLHMYGFLEQACAVSGSIPFLHIFKCAWTRGACFCSHHIHPFANVLDGIPGSIIMAHLVMFNCTCFWRLRLVFHVFCYSLPLGVTDVWTAGNTPPAGNTHFGMEHSGLGVWLQHGPHTDYHGQLTSISGSH